MKQLGAETLKLARRVYQANFERGLSATIPFLAVWQRHLRFARRKGGDRFT